MFRKNEIKTRDIYPSCRIQIDKKNDEIRFSPVDKYKGDSEFDRKLKNQFNAIIKSILSYEKECGYQFHNKYHKYNVSLTLERTTHSFWGDDRIPVAEFYMHIMKIVTRLHNENLIAYDQFFDVKRKITCKTSHYDMQLSLNDIVYLYQHANMPLTDDPAQTDMYKSRSHNGDRHLTYNIYNALLVDSGEDNEKLFRFFCDAINLLVSHNIISKPLSDSKTLSQLFSLSYKNKLWMCQFIHDLNETEKLNRTSFDEAMRLVNIKLPVPAISTVVKNSRKDTGHSRSELIVDSEISLFTEHKKSREYDEGVFGKVKRAYGSLDGRHAKFSIKKYLSEPDDLPDDVVKENIIEAKHEAKYYQLMGKHPHFFTRNNNVWLVYDWEKGANLYDYLRTEKGEKFLSSDLKSRLSSFCTLLESLNLLHMNFRVHNDIKINNVIIDDKRYPPKLTLIDYGTAHKPKVLSKDDLLAVFGRDQFSDDIPNIGDLGGYLFPELIDKKTDTMNAKEKSIRLLLAALCNFDQDKRITCRMAIDYCKRLLVNWPELDDNKLDEILNATIKNHELVLDDVLHGRVSMVN